MKDVHTVRRLALFTSLVFVGLWSQPAVHAQCSTETMSLVWSHPADGDTQVPVDASVVLITTQPLDDNWRTTLDGAEIQPFADGSFPLGGLEPDTDHVFRVAPAGSDDDEQELEIHFHTSSDSASRARSPDVVDSQQYDRAPSQSELCDRIHALFSCGEAVVPERTFNLESDGAVAWEVVVVDQPIRTWPAECNPIAEVQKASECFGLRAVQANGTPSRDTTFCPPPMPKPEDDSCSVARPGRHGSSIGLAFFVVACCGSLFRRRARAQQR